MDSQEEDNKVEITCPHCHKEFTLEDMSEVDCSACGTTTLSILTKKCKDPSCDEVYCKDCLDNLNSYGYCSNCENVSCDSCSSDIDRGEEVTCPKCKEANFCKDCAPNMVDKEVGCVECVSDDLTAGCAECRSTILGSKAILCKNFAECYNAYCEEHSAGNINSNGYCDDCQTLSCDSCGNDINRGDEITCPKCKESHFCKNCAEEDIDPAFGCIECISSDLKVTCSDCSNTIFKSKAVLCKNFAECGEAFCKEHSVENIDKKGYCESCNSFHCAHCENHFEIDQAIKCSNSKCGSGKLFCKQCSKLTIDSSGLCTNCSTKNVVTCANCNKQVFTEQTIKCENCDEQFCYNCTDKLLTECAKCHKKICLDCSRTCKKCKKTFCDDCHDFDKKCRYPDHRDSDDRAKDKVEDRQEIRFTETKKDSIALKSRKEIREEEMKKESSYKQNKQGFWAWFKENFL